MSRYVVGQKKWHLVDEGGPDPHVVARLQPNLLSFFKTHCGKHYGADAVTGDAPPEGTSFAPCHECGV